nr:hypothetical protein 294p2_00055 [Serratia marcescens]
MPEGSNNQITGILRNGFSCVGRAGLSQLFRFLDGSGNRFFVGGDNCLIAVDQRLHRYAFWRGKCEVVSQPFFSRVTTGAFHLCERVNIPDKQLFEALGTDFTRKAQRFSALTMPRGKATVFAVVIVFCVSVVAYN